jgi:hypothetical protein
MVLSKIVVKRNELNLNEPALAEFKVVGDLQLRIADQYLNDWIDSNGDLFNWNSRLECPKDYLPLDVEIVQILPHPHGFPTISHTAEPISCGVFSFRFFAWRTEPGEFLGVMTVVNMQRVSERMLDGCYMSQDSQFRFKLLHNKDKVACLEVSHA